MANKTHQDTIIWDGQSDTANKFIGEDYGVDWKYTHAHSSNIFIGKDHTKVCYLGDCIVRLITGGFQIITAGGEQRINMKAIELRIQLCNRYTGLLLGFNVVKCWSFFELSIGFLLFEIIITVRLGGKGKKTLAN